MALHDVVDQRRASGDLIPMLSCAFASAGARARAPPPVLLEGSSSSGSLYAPFVDAAERLFAECNLELLPYSLADEELMKGASGVSGAGARAQPVELTLRAYRTSIGVRQARIALIEGGSALQVLNFCIFPSIERCPQLPTFAADLVTLPGGHLIALDYAPNGLNTATDSVYAQDGALADAFARHRTALPDGGKIPEAASKYFSPYFLWSRLPIGGESDALIDSAVLPAFEDYLRGYLHLVNEAEAQCGGGEAAADDAAAAADAAASGHAPATAETAARAREAQLAYSRYRADEDPARPMLSRLFGEEYTERLIREVLFDLPLRLGSE